MGRSARFLLEVAKLPSLDPATSEWSGSAGPEPTIADPPVSQERGAIDLAGGIELFDEEDPKGVSDVQALAIQVVDAFVWQPMQWPPGSASRSWTPWTCRRHRVDPRYRPQRRKQDCGRPCR